MDSLADQQIRKMNFKGVKDKSHNIGRNLQMKVLYCGAGVGGSGKSSRMNASNKKTHMFQKRPQRWVGRKQIL